MPTRMHNDRRRRGEHVLAHEGSHGKSGTWGALATIARTLTEGRDSGSSVRTIGRLRQLSYLANKFGLPPN